ncbi:pyroglutamyl-peptidase I [Hyphomicrobium sp. ghe19]|uniref:pyroglutamyl-peptidase I n=1 Tax=Hyphomicrobium sp. ghe19 TaxID=2682968 RepID=UPI0013674A68|nr:Pyrrolidone-carboxylate peptidase [Hyphomicrobium sp. ghe19]
MGSRPTVLLTGFGPFPGVPTNASGELVRKLARTARRALPEFRFAVAILPTEWNRAPRLIANLHERHRPLLALHFGVAGTAKTIRLETEAANICRVAPDAAGTLPASAQLTEDGPAVRRSSIAAPAITAALNAKGYPSSISNDAGGYLCNAVLYHSLAAAEARGDLLVGFVHIPQDLSEPPLDMTAVSAAALEIIKIALDMASAESSLTLV